MNEAQSYSHKDVSDAFKTLGLAVGDYAGVDKAYKAMAKKNHPDLGGDPEKMKAINNAKDAIEKGAKVFADSGGYKRETEAEYEARNLERTEKAQAVTDYLFSTINPLVELSKEKFLKHFKDILGKDFNIEAKIMNKQAGHSTTGGAYGYHRFNGHAEWFLIFTSKTDATKFILELGATIYEREFETSISFDKLDPEVNFTTYAYSKGKKTKMQQKTWGLKRNASSLGEPNDFFPTKQLKKMITTALGRKTKRADAFAFLREEMKITQPYTNKDIVLIPIKGDNFIQIIRHVMMTKATWDFNKIVGKKGAYNYLTIVDLNTTLRSVEGGSGAYLAKMIYEEMPNFSEIMKQAVSLIEDGKYKEAGVVLSEANSLWINSQKKSESLVDLGQFTEYDECILNEQKPFKGTLMKHSKTTLTEYSQAPHLLTRENSTIDDLHKSIAELKEYIEELAPKIAKAKEDIRKAKASGNENEEETKRRELDRLRSSVDDYEDEMAADREQIKKLRGKNENNNKGNKMKNLSEQFLAITEQNAGASEADVILDPMDKLSKDQPDNIVEQEEADSELPQKLSMILGRLDKKPVAQKAEMQAALLQSLLKIIQELPAANRLLKGFIADANAVVIKGEEAPLA